MIEPSSQIKPLRDFLLVERLEGHGVERVTKGGIVIPATNEARAKTKNDYFRARVIAVGPDVKDPPNPETEHVLVYTWAGDETLYTGIHAGRNRLFIRPDDIVCAVDAEADVEALNARGLYASDKDPPKPRAA